MLEPVVAYVLSICVTRVEKEPDAPSKTVVLVEKDELAATKLEAVVSVFVTRVEKEPDAVSKLVSLVDMEPEPR
jgi:hypothetical protein